MYGALRRDAHPQRPEVPEHDLPLGRLAEDADVRHPAVAHEVARARRIAAVLRALGVALLGLLDLAGDGRDQQVAAQMRAGRRERPRRLDVARERALHVRDAEAVDAPVLLEALWLQPGDALQPRLAPRRRGVHVAVEHQARATARAGAHAEHVRAPVLDLLPLGRHTALVAQDLFHAARAGLLRSGEARDRDEVDRRCDQAAPVDLSADACVEAVHQRTCGRTCSPNRRSWPARSSPHISSMTCEQPASR